MKGGKGDKRTISSRLLYLLDLSACFQGSVLLYILRRFQTFNFMRKKNTEQASAPWMEVAIPAKFSDFFKVSSSIWKDGINNFGSILSINSWVLTYYTRTLPVFLGSLTRKTGRCADAF
jgi:hypothetical protein